MAFVLETNNKSGIAIIDQPGGLIATPENFIDTYTYASQYQPELIPQLMMRNGKGSIQGFLRFATGGKEDGYAADVIEHMELGRLHNVLKNVAVSGTGNKTFTSPTAHNLRVNQVIRISDGLIEAQGMVSAITSTTVFTVQPDSGTAFAFTGNVTVLGDFSNRFNKGTNSFDTGRNWNPTPYYNYTHIVKETYEVSESMMDQKTWVNTPYGPMWFNQEMERTGTLFDNLGELTAIFHERAADNSASATAGFAKGMNGVVPQIETRGNISHDLITTTQNLSDIAFRAKQQGACREFTVFASHAQMAAFRVLCAGVNSAFVNGSYYGAFQNSKDMALALDFSSIHIDGVTFHFTPWSLLDDPTLMGATQFRTTSLAYLMIPTGKTDVMIEGDTQSKPYLTMRYRKAGEVNRRRKVQFFGCLGTPQRADKTTVDYLTEMTNQVIGANNYFVGRAGTYPTV